MKLLFVSMSTFYGGGEVYLNNLINYMDNDTINYLATPKVDRLINEVNDACEDILFIKGSRKNVISDGLKIRKFILDNDIDAVILNGYDAALISPLIKCKKKIYVNHNSFVFGNSIKKKLATLSKKFIFSNIDSIIALSEYNKQQFLEKNLCEESKITIIFNGISTEKYTYSLSEDKEKVVIGEIARLDKIKGQIDLIEAFSLAKKDFNKEVELIFIGAGEYKDNILKKISSSKLENIKLIGYSNEIDKWLKEIDIYCLPSYEEAAPFSILEAMASGKAIIASKVGGVPEMIDDGKTGLLIEPGNISQLSKYLIRLVNSHEDRVVLGKMARRAAENEFELDTLMEKTKNIIKNN